MVMSSAAASGGPVLLPEQVSELVVRPVVGELGGDTPGQSVASQVCRTIPITAPELRVPIVNTDPTLAWVNENAEVPASDLGLSELVVTPKAAAGIVRVSNELIADSSPSAQQMIGDRLVAEASMWIDLDLFGSPQPSPAPVGLEALQGVSEVDAGAAWTSLDPFAEALSICETKGVRANAIVAHPSDVLALSKLRDEANSLRPLLGSDPSQPTRRVIFGVPLISCAQVVPGHAWAIPRDRALLVVRQQADLIVYRERYAEFRQTGLLVDLRVAYAFPAPDAIVKVELTP